MAWAFLISKQTLSKHSSHASQWFCALSKRKTFLTIVKSDMRLSMTTLRLNNLSLLHFEQELVDLDYADIIIILIMALEVNRYL